MEVERLHQSAQQRCRSGLQRSIISSIWRRGGGLIAHRVLRKGALKLSVVTVDIFDDKSLVTIYFINFDIVKTH